MIEALIREIQLRKKELQNETIETIYIGGGTPSLLTIEEIQLLLNAIYINYRVVEKPEITLEANPDDLKEDLDCREIISITILVHYKISKNKE